MTKGKLPDFKRFVKANLKIIPPKLLPIDEKNIGDHVDKIHEIRDEKFARPPTMTFIVI